MAAAALASTTTTTAAAFVTHRDNAVLGLLKDNFGKELLRLREGKYLKKKYGLPPIQAAIGEAMQAADRTLVYISKQPETHQPPARFLAKMRHVRGYLGLRQYQLRRNGVISNIGYYHLRSSVYKMLSYVIALERLYIDAMCDALLTDALRKREIYE